MMICRVTGSVYSTQKNERLKGNRLLIVQPVDLDAETARGPSFLALDIADAGQGDLVLVMREGGSARIIFNDEKIPLQAVVVGVVDRVDVDHAMAKTKAIPG